MVDEEFRPCIPNEGRQIGTGYRDPPIVYAAISRDRRIVVEFCARGVEDDGIFSKTTRQALMKLPRSRGSSTYIFQNYCFAFLVGISNIYICVSPLTTKNDIPLLFLSRLRSKVQETHEMRPSVSLLEIDADSSRLVVELLDEFQEGRAGGTQAIERIEKELETVTVLVKQNINTVLQRSEQIESLVGRTSNLKDAAVGFRSSARRLKRKFWWSNVRFYVIVGLLLLGLGAAFTYVRYS